MRLRPCQRCGSNHIYIEIEDLRRENVCHSFDVRCTCRKCGLQVGQFVGSDFDMEATPKEFIEYCIQTIMAAWNSDLSNSYVLKGVME